MSNVLGYSVVDLVYNKFDNSFFREFFDLNDPELLQWSLSVLEKIYDKGVLPSFIERNNGDNIFYDEDFISWFFTKTHFFAIFVKYARVFENIKLNDILKVEFLNNIGLYFSIDQSSADLTYLIDNYISEFNKRGTNRIWAKDGELGNTIDGELLRLISYKTYNEFIFALLASNEVSPN